MSFNLMSDAVGRIELALDIPCDQVDGEQVAQMAQLRILLELAQVGERHAGVQLLQALFGHPAVRHEFRIPLENRLGEQLAARNLDAELALEPENNVQKVDRLCPEVALKS